MTTTRNTHKRRPEPFAMSCHTDQSLYPQPIDSTDPWSIAVPHRSSALFVRAPGPPRYGIQYDPSSPPLPSSLLPYPQKNTTLCTYTKKNQVTKSVSMFSLAPLRYSAAPTFSPARCLDSDVLNKTVEKMTAKARSNYQRRTWGRRWTVTIALWCGFVLTMVAGTLLVAGRRLQHRCVRKKSLQ